MSLQRRHFNWRGDTPGEPHPNEYVEIVRHGQVEVAGHRIAYRASGSGPPLVLLHGWPLDGRQWRRQLDGLSDDFRVVAWDAPGAGRSSDPPETFRLADWADCLAEFIEILDLAPAHVAGLSFGGGLALELFHRHPDVVRSLILMSAYAGWGGSLPAEEVQQRLALTRRNTTLPPEEWVPALIDTLLPARASPELAEDTRAACGLCGRKMQGSWNGGRANYRCRYPNQYALANNVEHPRSVYVREDAVLPRLDGWLGTIFDPANLDATVAALADVNGDNTTRTEIERCRQALADR